MKKIKVSKATEKAFKKVYGYRQRSVQAFIEAILTDRQRYIDAKGGLL